MLVGHAGLLRAHTAHLPLRRWSLLIVNTKRVTEAPTLYLRLIGWAAVTCDRPPIPGCSTSACCNLAGLMKDLGVPLNATQLSQAITQLDVNQSGKITFGEFLLWWKG